MRGLTGKSLVGIAMLAGAVAWPLGASQVSAAPAQGNATNGTIIKIQAGAGTTTTPDACTGALNECAHNGTQVS